MVLNNNAMTTIEGAHKEAPSQLLQAISLIKLGPTADEITAEVFTLAMDKSAQVIEMLILEAEVSSRNLDQMDEDIRRLHKMIAREDKRTNAERDRLKDETWTKFGGNKQAVRDYTDRLALLNDLGKYRKQAAEHVKTAEQALRTMGDDLRVLRERVAAPGLLESKEPFHVYVESIRNGLWGLQESRMRVARARYRG